MKTLLGPGQVFLRFAAFARSLREIAVELEAVGHVTSAGTRYGAAAIARMVGA